MPYSGVQRIALPVPWKTEEEKSWVSWREASDCREQHEHTYSLRDELLLYASQNTHSPNLLFTLTALHLLNFWGLEGHTLPSCHPKAGPVHFALQDESTNGD